MDSEPYVPKCALCDHDLTDKWVQKKGDKADEWELKEGFQEHLRDDCIIVLRERLKRVETFLESMPV